MDANHVLQVVLHEMTAYGAGWRNDWSGFDGRTLRDQLNDLETWARAALKADQMPDYTSGSSFYDNR